MSTIPAGGDTPGRPKHVRAVAGVACGALSAASQRDLRSSTKVRHGSAGDRTIQKRLLNAAAALTAVAVLVTVLVGTATSTPANAQESEFESDDLAQLMHVEARRLEDGRTEFALRLHDPGNPWQDRILPNRRFFPVRATTDRWLWSAPIVLRLASDDPDVPSERVWVRITARRLADGRVEFGLQHRGPGGRWGERLLPERRFFPAVAGVGRWLVSSPVTVRRLPFSGFAVGGGSRSGDTLVAASFRRTCAVTPGGGMTCWGDEGTRERLSAAVLEDVLAVSVGDSSAGRFHTCSLHGDGRVSCWGPGGDGELGLGDAADRFLPVKVPGIRDATAIATGAVHTCAVHRSGWVSCWGDGSRGQLGSGAEESSLSPRIVPGVEGVATIAAGSHSSCAVHTDGGVSCWGWGATTRTGHLSPRRISGLGGVVSVAVGWSHTCVVRADGRVYCWAFSDAVRPARVAGISDAVAVSVGDRSFCAVHRDGGVSCWGGNNDAGQLGDGSTIPHSEPTRLEGISDAVAVTVSTPSRGGQGHACAMRADGSVSCWGDNAFGQLGDGTFEPRLTPTPVQDFEGFVADEVPAGPTEFLRTWIDLVIEEREAEFPWLRLAWDHVRHRTYLVGSVDVDGYARSFCHGHELLLICMSDRVVVRSTRLATLIHELAHAYDFTPGLVAPKAWGAVQLYFAVTYPDCYIKEGFGAGVELLADTMEHLVVPTAWLSYYNPPVEFAELPFDSADCPNVLTGPTEEAEAVVRAGLAGEVPDWYTENITSGAELWAAIRQGPSVRIMLHLKDEFGGFCRLDWLRYPLNLDRWPSEDDNQFRDGGCS